MAPKTAFETKQGNGGETHQRIPEKGPHDAAGHLTTNQGIRVSDNQNSLKSGARGPTLLEDFVLREKIFHFDHERIPERIVHARGSGAHGYFESTEEISDLSKATLFKNCSKETIGKVAAIDLDAARKKARTVLELAELGRGQALGR